MLVMLSCLAVEAVAYFLERRWLACFRLTHNSFSNAV